MSSDKRPSPGWLICLKVVGTTEEGQALPTGDVFKQLFVNAIAATRLSELVLFSFFLPAFLEL